MARGNKRYRVVIRREYVQLHEVEVLAHNKVEAVQLAKMQARRDKLEATTNHLSSHSVHAVGDYVDYIDILWG
jgi:hypothetical protein